MDKNMTLEKRIAAELYCYQGKMSVFVDDLQGHTVEVGADEEFETASTIKRSFSLHCICRRSAAKQTLPKRSPMSRASLWTAAVCCARWAWAQSSR